jgi:DNA-binding NarL/FixJ family response regulator
VERAKPTKPVRVLLMNMPRLLFDMIKGTIVSCQTVQVVNETIIQGKILPAAVAAKADVVIVDDKDASTENCYQVLYRRPQLRILMISRDGRRGLLYELRPRITAIEEISAENLIAALRGRASIAGNEEMPQQ